MPITKKHVSQFLNEVNKISHKQQLALKDFDQRIGTLYDHKKSIQALILGLTLLKKEDRKGGRDQVLKEIHFIKHNVIAEFASIIEGAIKDRELELALIKREHQKFDEKADIAFHEFEILLEDLKKGKDKKKRAEEKCLHILEAANKKLKNPIEEIKNIIKNMGKILKKQSKVLLEELEILQSLEQALHSSHPISPKTIDTSKKKLKKVIEELMYILHTEKEKIIEPFNHFLKEKRSIMKKLKKRASQVSISFEDISKDIETFTEPSEVRMYFAGLNKYTKKIAKNARDITSLTSHIENILHFHKKKRHAFQKTI